MSDSKSSANVTEQPGVSASGVSSLSNEGTFVKGDGSNRTTDSGYATAESSVAHKNEKWDIFQQTIRHQAENESNPYEKIELLALLQESRDHDLIQSLVREIDFVNVVFTPAATHAVASVMRMCQHLALFRLVNCKLDKDSTKIFEIITNNLHIEVDTTVLAGPNIHSFAKILGVIQTKLLMIFSREPLHEPLSWMPKPRPSELSTILVFEVQSSAIIKFFGSSSFFGLPAVTPELRDNIVAKLKETFETIKVLDVSKNGKLRKIGFDTIGSAAAQCNVEEVLMNDCKLEGKDLKEFNNGASYAKFRKLDVSANKTLGPEGMYVLGKLVKNHDVTELAARDLNAQSDHVVELFGGLGDAVMDSLDLSDRIHHPHYTRSLLDLLHHVRTKLYLYGWKINAIQTNELEHRLQEIGSPSLYVIFDPKGSAIYFKGSTVDSMPESKTEEFEDALEDSYSDKQEAEIVSIPFSATKEKQLFCVKGGEIEIYDCKVRVPAGGLEDDYLGRVTLESGNTYDRPDNIIPISPALESNLKVKPGFEMDVEIPTFCFADEPVEVYLFSRTNGSKNWIVERKMLLGRERRLCFKTSRFSRWLFGILRSMYLSRVAHLLKFPLIPHLYFLKNDWLFHLYFCVDHELKDGKLRESYHGSEYKDCLKIPEPHFLKIGDQLEAKLTCPKPEFQKVLGFKNWTTTLEFNEELIDKIYVRKDIDLDCDFAHAHEKSFNCPMKMHFFVGKKGTELKEMIFALPWPKTNETSPGPPGQSQPITLSGGVTAQRDVIIAGQRHYMDNRQGLESSEKNMPA